MCPTTPVERKCRRRMCVENLTAFLDGVDVETDLPESPQNSWFGSYFVKKPKSKTQNHKKRARPTSFQNKSTDLSTQTQTFADIFSGSLDDQLLLSFLTKREARLVSESVCKQWSQSLLLTSSRVNIDIVSSYIKHFESQFSSPRGYTDVKGSGCTAVDIEPLFKRPPTPEVRKIELSDDHFSAPLIPPKESPTFAVISSPSSLAKKRNVSDSLRTPYDAPEFDRGAATCLAFSENRHLKQSWDTGFRLSSHGRGSFPIKIPQPSPNLVLVLGSMHSFDGNSSVDHRPSLPFDHVDPDDSEEDNGPHEDVEDRDELVFEIEF